MSRRARQLLIREIARQEATRVLSESTPHAAIEKMAEEFARDRLRDPKFRAYPRAEARQGGS